MPTRSQSAPRRARASQRLPGVTAQGSETPAELAMRLSVAITRLRSRLRAQAGAVSGDLPGSQLSMLRRVYDEGPITVSALAAAEHVRQQSGTQGVAVLREAGLVTTAGDPLDGRRVLVSATARGRRMLEQIMESREAWLAGAIGALSPHRRPDVAVLVDLLEELAGTELTER